MLWLPRSLKVGQLSSETQQALFKSFITAFWLSVIFYSSGAFAASLGGVARIPDLQTLLMNLAADVPSVMRLVTAGAYVIGIFMIVAAVVGMKHLGELRTMMAREHGFWGPLLELLVGAALIYLPTSVQSVMSTFWQSPAPYAYITQDTASNATFVNACYTVIQLIGTVAFIRGLLMLQQAGSERAQPHMLGKALSHLVGGILCINIYGTLQTLEKTVGMIS